MINNLLTSGLIFGAIGGLLYSLKGIPVFLFGKIKQKVVFTTRIYQYDDLFEILEKWLSNNYQYQYRNVEGTLKTTSQYMKTSSPRDIGKEVTVPNSIDFKQEENTFIITYNKKKIIIIKSKEKLEKAGQSTRDFYFRKYTLSGFFAKKQIESLLNETVRCFKEEEEKNTVKVHSSSSYGEWYASRSVYVKPLEYTILNSSLKKEIVDDLDNFLQSEDWYKDTCIPYKRGYCFYGPPGTGKTTLALAIANHTRRKVYCLNLNSLDDDSRMPLAFSDMQEGSILLLEDIDKVFSGRENVKEGSKITFSSLLNCLDGAFYKQGLITIITTNHIDKLDPALLRTGRIDMKKEVPRPSLQEITEYLKIFYRKPISIPQLDIELGWTMSDIQEICLKSSSPKEAIKKILSYEFA